jgi:hypothetical protein
MPAVLNVCVCGYIHVCNACICIDWSVGNTRISRYRLSRATPVMLNVCVRMYVFLCVYIYIIGWSQQSYASSV